MFSRIIMPRLRVQQWFLLMINLVILVKFPGNSLPIPHHAEDNQSPDDFLDDVKRKGAPDQATIDEYDFEHSGGGRGSLRGSENGEQTIENSAPPNFQEKFMETKLIIFISVSANSFIIIRV